MRTFLDFDSIYKQVKKEIENIKDGSAFVQKNNLAILTGEITSNAGSLDTPSFTSKKINFPDGFNSNNCMVISYSVQREGFPIGFGYTNPTSSQTWLRGGVSAMVSFDTSENEEIIFTLESPFSTSQKYNYRILLMKI